MRFSHIIVTEENEKSCANVSEEDSQQIIKKLFLVDMPADFFSFWSFCKSSSPQNPRGKLLNVNTLEEIRSKKGFIRMNSYRCSKVPRFDASWTI